MDPTFVGILSAFLLAGGFLYWCGWFSAKKSADASAKEAISGARLSEERMSQMAQKFASELTSQARPMDDHRRCEVLIQTERDRAARELERERISCEIQMKRMHEDFERRREDELRALAKQEDLQQKHACELRMMQDELENERKRHLQEILEQRKQQTTNTGKSQFFEKNHHFEELAQKIYSKLVEPKSRSVDEEKAKLDAFMKAQIDLMALKQKQAEQKQAEQNFEEELRRLRNMGKGNNVPYENEDGTSVVF